METRRQQGGCDGAHAPIGCCRVPYSDADSKPRGGTVDANRLAARARAAGNASPRLGGSRDIRVNDPAGGTCGRAHPARCRRAGKPWIIAAAATGTAACTRAASAAGCRGAGLPLGSFRHD